MYACFGSKNIFPHYVHVKHTICNKLILIEMLLITKIVCLYANQHVIFSSYSGLNIGKSMCACVPSWCSNDINVSECELIADIIISNFHFAITENNLMGAAEWTGYSGTTPSYSPFSSLQSTPSSYNYDNTSIAEHHSNFHIPTGKFFLTGQTFRFQS